MGLFSSIGKMFNDITGATSAAQLQNKYQKEFAQNAHQWEVEDLKKAGLNPILSAGGSGATAGGAGGTTGASGINPMDMASSAAGIAETMANAGQLKAQQALTKAQTLKTMLESDILDGPTRKKLEAEYNLTVQQVLESKANTKFTNERARGFSSAQTVSNSYGGGIGPVKGDYSEHRHSAKSW